ncbi:MAG: ATP synthase F1 subunit epsilon [Ruminococcaceae bacterium]|nr:ATP synthase F1 subunit epsilon [Oscillospiraceae bacterium]
MANFPLKIVTSDGLIFDGMAEKVIVRTIRGDMAVLARHINCVAPLGMGRAVVEVDGRRRTAACIGGMLNVVDGAVTLVPTTFEWAEDIDPARAQAAAKRAEELLAKRDALTEQEVALADAKLKRALIRQNVYRGE